jgi:hypothetical protein
MKKLGKKGIALMIAPHTSRACYSMPLSDIQQISLSRTGILVRGGPFSRIWLDRDTISQEEVRHAARTLAMRLSETRRNGGIGTHTDLESPREK